MWVAVGVGVAVAVWVGVGVGVWVAVGVGVAVAVRVGMGVGVWVAEGVGVGVPCSIAIDVKATATIVRTSGVGWEVGADDAERSRIPHPITPTTIRARRPENHERHGENLAM